MEKEKCKEMVRGEGRYGSFHRHRCSFNAVKDGFCNIHHPNKVAERLKKSDEAYEEKRKKSPWYRFSKAEERIKYLEDLLKKNKIKFK